MKCQRRESYYFTISLQSLLYITILHSSRTVSSAMSTCKHYQTTYESTSQQCLSLLCSKAMGWWPALSRFAGRVAATLSRFAGRVARVAPTFWSTLPRLRWWPSTAAPARFATLTWWWWWRRWAGAWSALATFTRGVPMITPMILL